MTTQAESRSVAGLVLLDGIQVAVLLTVLPFMLISGEEGPSGSMAEISPLGIGIALGIGGTLVIGRVVDRINPYAVLQGIQALQIFLLLCVIAFSLFGWKELVPLSVVCAVTVARSSGPAKDKIRAFHIDSARRVTFNSFVRRWFLVIGQVVIVVITLLLSNMPRPYWPTLLFLSIAAIVASIFLTIQLQKLARAGGPTPSRQPGALVKPRRGPLLLALSVITCLGIGAALPTVGLTAWIAHYGYPIWILGAFGVYIVFVDFWFTKALGHYLDAHPEKWASAHRVGAIILLVGLCGVWISGLIENTQGSLLALGISLTISTLAYSMSVMLAMEVQFGYGDHASRGAVASYTRSAAVAGSAIAATIAPALILGGGVITTLAIAASVLVLLVPRSSMSQCLGADGAESPAKCAHPRSR